MRKIRSARDRRLADRASQSLLESLESRTLLSSLGTMDLQYQSLSPGAAMTGVVLGGAAPATYNSGVINFKRTGGTYTTPPAVNDTVPTFCLELKQVVVNTATYDVVPLTEAPVPGELGSGPMSDGAADRLRELWGRYRGSVGTDNVRAEAFQMAIWEIVHDSTLDLSSGTFSVAPTDANTTAAKTQAETWLASLDGTGPEAKLLALTNQSYQDLLFEAPVASIGDLVWIDTNANGIQDSGEIGLPDVTVQLLDSAGANVLKTTTTDADGNYLFGGLDPGDYRIRVIAPTGYTFSPQDQGSDDNLDSDANATGLMASTTLIGNENDLSWDAGLVAQQQGGEGLTPGFWKQKQHFWAWTGYKPTDSFEAVFGVDAPGNPTLLDALKTGGGKKYALDRHAVAALLNATSPYVDYKYTVPEIISMVQQAYATGNYNTTKNLFEQQNELGTKEDIGQFKP